MNDVVKERRPWTDVDRDHLRRRVAFDSIETLARDLNRSVGAVRVELSVLGIFRDRVKTAARPRKPWTGADDHYLIENRARPLAEIALVLNRTAISVAARIHELGLEDPRRWTKEEDQIAVGHYEWDPGISVLLPGRSWQAIVQRANKFGLRRRCSNTPVDGQFFDLPLTREAVSVLGLFHADGHLFESGNGFSFSQADREPLERVSRLMKSGGTIEQKKNRTEFVLTIFNGRLADNLRSFGYDHRKTFTAKVPSVITPEMYPIFFGRLHEGDGSVGLEVSRKHPDRVCGYVQFLGTEETLQCAREFFIGRGVSPQVHVTKHGKTKTHKLKYKGEDDVIKLIPLLYPSKDMALTSKYDKAIAVLNSLLAYRARDNRRSAEHNRKIMLSRIAGRKWSWPDLLAPDGTRHQVLSPGDIARKHGLTQIGIWSVLRGAQKQHRGWTRAID